MAIGEPGKKYFAKRNGGDRGGKFDRRMVERIGSAVAQFFAAGAEEDNCSDFFAAASANSF